MRVARAGTGTPAPEPEPSALAEILASHSGVVWEPWLIASAGGTGAAGGDAEPITTWLDTTSTYGLTPGTNTPNHRVSGFGPPTFSSAHHVAAFGSPHVDLTQDTLVSDAAALRLPAGATCQPWGLVITLTRGDDSAAAASTRASFAWGSVTGGTAGPMISLRRDILRFHFPNNQNLDVSIGLPDTAQELTLIITCGGHNGRLRVDCLQAGTWTTTHNTASLAITAGGSTNLSGLTRVSIGGNYAGSSTQSDSLLVGRIAQLALFIPPSDDTELSDLFTELRAALATQWEDTTPHVLTSRAAVITAGTTGFSPPETSLSTDIAFASVWEASPGDYWMAFAGHNALVISVAHCVGGDPLDPADWEIDSGGTGISTTALATAAGYTTNGSSHLASPDVYNNAGTLSMFVHAELVGGGHAEFALVGTDFLGGEGVGWDFDSFGGEFRQTNPIDGTTNYLRRFQWNGRWYAIGNTGRLYKGPTVAASPNGVAVVGVDGRYDEVSDSSAFQNGLFTEFRHAGVIVRGDWLLVAYSSYGEYEHVKIAAVALSADPLDWRMVNPETLDASREYAWVWPYLAAEGTTQQFAFSDSGEGTVLRRQLRDPVFHEAADGRTLMFWNGGAEKLIVGADVTDPIDDLFEALAA